MDIKWNCGMLLDIRHKYESIISNKAFLSRKIDVKVDSRRSKSILWKLIIIVGTKTVNRTRALQTLMMR